MSWNSQNERISESDELGCKLSIALDCPVHRIAGLDIFECRCGVIFPLYLIRRENWATIRRRHDEERHYI